MTRPRVLGPALGLLLAALCLSSAGSQTDPDRKEPEAPTVRIGTWNIQWLGRPDKRFEGPQKPEDVAEYIRKSGVDLLGLNEITHDTNSKDPPTNKTLGEACKLLKEKTGKTFTHRLFPREDQADKDQLVGVLWNADRVKLVGDPLRVPIRRGAPSAEVWRRAPYAAKFSFADKKTDVVVIPVHMKSNLGGEEAMARVRAEEAKLLVRSLGAVQNHFTDDDVVILGDTNCLRKTEGALTRYAAAGLRDLNGDEHKSWIKSSRYEAAPFDRVLVPDDQPEFRDAKLTVFKNHHLNDEFAFRKKCSDHYMVIADVKVLDDDD